VQRQRGDRTATPEHHPANAPANDPIMLIPFSLSTPIWSEKGYRDAMAIFPLFFSFLQA